MARRPTREIIADFIKQNPDVSMDEILDAMFLDSTHLHAYIHELIDLGMSSAAVPGAAIAIPSPMALISSQYTQIRIFRETETQQCRRSIWHSN